MDARKALTLPARLGKRNQRKRDAPTVWDVQRAFSPDLLLPGASMMRAGPQDEDSQSEASVCLSEQYSEAGTSASGHTGTGGSWPRCGGSEKSSDPGGSWPRVRKQRTPNGAMDIWELSEALGQEPCEDLRSSEQRQSDQHFVNQILGAPESAPPQQSDFTPTESETLRELGADLSRATLTEQQLSGRRSRAEDAILEEDESEALAQLEAIAARGMAPAVTMAGAAPPTPGSAEDDDPFAEFSADSAELLAILESPTVGDVDPWAAVHAAPAADLAPQPPQQLPPQQLPVQAQARPTHWHGVPIAHAIPTPAPLRGAPFATTHVYVDAHAAVPAAEHYPHGTHAPPPSPHENQQYAAAGGYAPHPAGYGGPVPEGYVLDASAARHAQYAGAAVGGGAPHPMPPHPHEGALAGRHATRNGPERKEWTPLEDDLIRKGVVVHGCRWRKIAAQLPGRSDDAVRNRWNRLREAGGDDAAIEMPSNARKPRGARKVPVSRSPTPGASSSASGSESLSSPNTEPTGSAFDADKEKAAKSERDSRVSWSRTEDAIIVDSVQELGHKWYQISQRLPGRTDHAIRNRYHRLQAMVEDAQKARETNDAADVLPLDASDAAALFDAPDLGLDLTAVS